MSTQTISSHFGRIPLTWSREVGPNESAVNQSVEYSVFGIQRNIGQPQDNDYIFLPHYQNNAYVFTFPNIDLGTYTITVECPKLTHDEFEKVMLRNLCSLVSFMFFSIIGVMLESSKSTHKVALIGAYTGVTLSVIGLLVSSYQAVQEEFEFVKKVIHVTDFAKSQPQQTATVQLGEIDPARFNNYRFVWYSVLWLHPKPLFSR